MVKISALCTIIALALASSAIAQTTPVSFDGCTKNCLQCQRAAAPVASPGINLKTCNICLDSSPKVSTVAPLNFDCSGAAIANCQFHTVTDKTTGAVACTACHDRHLLKTSGTTTTCEALGAEYTNCRQGTADECTLCDKGYTRVKVAPATNFNKKCDPIASDKVITNCEAYSTTDGVVTCNRCLAGFKLATDFKTCTAIPAEEQVCFLGWENTNNQVTCTTCNYMNKQFSVDSVYVATGTQRQICAKQGGMMLFIIIGIIVLVVIVAVIVVMRRGKSSNEAELKGSMISKN